jgi:hypothetical protein
MLIVLDASVFLSLWTSSGESANADSIDDLREGDR